MNGQYQYDLTEKLSFVRVGGTEGEAKAAQIILDEIKSAGGEGHIQEFKIPASECKKCSLKAVKPFEMEIETISYGCSGSLPKGGVDLKLYYAGRGVEEDYYGVEDLSDSIVMVNEFNFDVYKLICKKKAAAFMVIQGKHYHSSENWSFFPRNVREKYLENGKVPGFFIWAKDATELIRNNAEIIHAELEQTDVENTSRNVLAVIEGSEIKNESIIVVGHYDSVGIGTGSWDNATGSVTLLWLYRYFLENKPKRTLRFIWAGSEEMGLLGSKAYAKEHKELIEKEVKFCFNFDMCGTILGKNVVFVTGGDNLTHYAQQFCNEYGMSAEILTLVHSSDSSIFADMGIPALGLTRETNTADIHTRYDVMFPLSAYQLGVDGDFAAAFISRVANSARMPVALGMPDDMKEKLEKYFQRDKKSIKDEEKEKQEKEEKEK